MALKPAVLPVGGHREGIAQVGDEIGTKLALSRHQVEILEICRNKIGAEGRRIVDNL